MGDDMSKEWDENIQKIKDDLVFIGKTIDELKNGNESLLKACKMMLDTWEELNDEFNMGDCEATVTAREAIAKAEWGIK